MSDMTNRCWLECIVCGSKPDLAPLLKGCPRCHDRGRRIPLEVRYDLARIDAVVPDSGATGIWRWRALLPGVRSSSITSLAEGGTPMPPLEGDGGGLLLKNETSNPTWSWKDRGISASVSVAREFGFRRISAVSTGNHGVAAAAYAAAAGIECAVFRHADASPLQMAPMDFYGARVFRGGRREEMLTRLVARGDWFPASLTVLAMAASIRLGSKGSRRLLLRLSPISEAKGPMPSLFRPAAAMACTVFGRGSASCVKRCHKPPPTYVPVPDSGYRPLRPCFPRTLIADGRRRAGIDRCSVNR